MAKVAKSSKSRGGARPGERRGGRKKGTRNKKTAALVEAIEASGETPLDYMLRVMRDPRTEHERRDRMAASVAPYVHAKLASMVLAGDPNKPLNVLTRVEHVIVRPQHQDGGGVRAAPGTEQV